MTVEITTDLSRKTATKKWAPKSRRQGEPAGWEKPPSPASATHEGSILTPPSPPPVRPRVFPGI